MKLSPWCRSALASLAALALPAWAAEPPHAARPPGIDWFEGDVSAAFAQAQARQRPVFLYWGAVWCPPCQELKATIFRRRDFQDRLKLFVPVYLDGDGAGAQAWGERFHVSGYPTVLVLRGDQVELERVSGGMDLARYAEVLDLALGQERPVQELLGEAGARTPLAADDCRRLAYNAWMLDEAWLQHPEALGGLAARLAGAAQRCPAGLAVERGRLRMTAVHAAVSAEAKALAAGAAPGAALQALLEPVPRLLADDRVAPAIGDALWYLPAEFFPAAAAAYARAAPGDGRAALRARWFARMDALAADRRYSASDRLDALRSKLVCAKALATEGKVPAALAAAATRRIDEELAREHEPHARSSLVNSALNALEVLDDDARAHDILAGEIATSEFGYYYMADLADLEEKQGHPDLALQWLARSYETAQGPATRFQWGVGWVRGLVRLHPQDEPAIRDAAVAVLGELDASGDLHGRSLRSLRRLEDSLREWNRDAAHAQALAAIRARLQPVCGRMGKEEAGREACLGFLG